MNPSNVAVVDETTLPTHPFSVEDVLNFTGEDVLLVREGQLIHLYRTQGLAKVRCEVRSADPEVFLSQRISVSTDLPEPQDGVWFLVSQEVFLGLSDRHDLVYGLEPQFAQFATKILGFVGR